MKKALTEIFERDLKKLKEELKLYNSEEGLWMESGEAKNSAGNLALHLIGNLKHFIGAILGGSSYVRNREAEFADKDVPLHDILVEVDQTVEIVKRTIEQLNEEQLDEQFPVEILGGVTTRFFLIHLATHLNYHLGQVNYHRRLLEL